jgi:hypothetical protein
VTVTGMLAAATSDTTASFAVSVTTGPVRIIYSTAEPVAGVAIDPPAYSASTAVDAQLAAKVTLTGLTARTRYWWRVEDNGVEDTSRTGTILTPPPAGAIASFTFAASGDAGQTPIAPGFTNTELEPERISNHQVHALIGQRMLGEDWLFHLDMGDRTYYDLGNLSSGFPDSTLTNYRRMYSDLQLQPNQRTLYDSGSDVYVWDDHDFGPNDSDGTFTGKGNAAQVFRERVPHHTLPDTGGIYRSFQYGRVLVVVWDCRYDRSPIADPEGPAKTMLGAAQKSWFQNLIQTTTAEAIVIVSSVQWMSGGGGGWAGYTTERQEIADMVTAAGKADRVVMLSADAHVNAIDTGGNNAWGGWPCAIFASRDATAGTLIADYDIYGPNSDRAQYGTVTITDLGGLIAVKLTAWQGATEMATYTKAIAATSPVSAVDITDAISGSHQVITEAIVCTEYQTGTDPQGESIEVLSGDVQYDETAEVWSTMSLTTDGLDDDLVSLFPRRADDLLAPYGNEVFLRYGIDIGPEILWTSLGYFRLNDVEQPGASDDPIRLTGTDRWQSIVDGKLLAPRQYLATQSIAAVVYDLVLDVYPNAIVAWDDDDNQLPLGRTLVVEKDRAAALRDIATSRGKVCYFDGDGVLRFEAVPDPESIVWDIKAGANGVLVSSGRSVSRTGMYNAVVARGEGTDTAAIGIAVDAGESSPTRWTGRFGKVPREYASPLILDAAGAYSAAAAILARSIGMPKSVNFGTVPNPTLRPRQAVRITQKDHNRERHIVSQVSIPLVAGQAMRGDTREQTLTRIGRVMPGSPDL